MTQPPNFIDGERQCSPGTRHPFELLRHRGLAAPDVAFDGFADLVELHAAIVKVSRGCSFSVREQSKQQVFGADVTMAPSMRLLRRQLEDVSRSIVE